VYPAGDLLNKHTRTKTVYIPICTERWTLPELERARGDLNMRQHCSVLQLPNCVQGRNVAKPIPSLRSWYPGSALPGAGWRHEVDPVLSINVIQNKDIPPKAKTYRRTSFGEHAVLTREIIAHAKRCRKNLHMVQIDFSNAFGSVPRQMIELNMVQMGIPVEVINPIMDIYQGCQTVIVTPGWESDPIDWTSGTV
jgi:hypothetical protein